MGTDLKILLHSEAQLLDYGESRTSGPWIKVRLPDHELLDPFRGMDVGGSGKTTPNIHITIAEGDIATLADQSDAAPAKQPTPYGDASTLLWKSAFFRSPAIWFALGLNEACTAEAKGGNIKAAQTKAWDALKSALGYESMADVPPAVVVEWAKNNGIERYLPAAYVNLGGK